MALLLPRFFSAELFSFHQTPIFSSLQRADYLILRHKPHFFTPQQKIHLPSHRNGLSLIELYEPADNIDALMNF